MIARIAGAVAWHSLGVLVDNSAKPIELNEVGPYGVLLARPNPAGFAILQVPPFESLLPFLAKRYGRRLTPNEVDAERSKAPSIVVTQSDATRMAIARDGAK